MRAFRRKLELRVSLHSSSDFACIVPVGNFPCSFKLIEKWMNQFGPFIKTNVYYHICVLMPFVFKVYTISLIGLHFAGHHCALGWAACVFVS